MKRLLTTLLTAGAALGLALAPTTAAHAEGSGGEVTKKDKLVLEALNADNEPATDGSFIRWDSKGGDSPIDTNDLALHVRIKSPTGQTYADAYSKRMLKIDKRTGDVENLSYDARLEGLGAGSPRISVILSDGSVVYLTASTCKTPIAASSGTWIRADFTGATDNCSFYDSAGTQYAADGTHSAWNAYAQAHPNLRVQYAFLVLDEGPVEGQNAVNVFLDRIAIGTDLMYNSASDRAVKCKGDEDRC